MVRFISLAVVLLGINAFSLAQDSVSTKWRFQQPGDYSLTINANPFLNYIGNLLSRSGSNSAPTFNSLGTQSLIGSYTTSEHTTYRGLFRIGAANNTITGSEEQYPQPTNLYPGTPPLVVDRMSNNSIAIALGVGIEKKRPIYGRLQGYYGADAMLGITNQTVNYTYGNSLSGMLGASNYDSTVTSNTHNFITNTINHSSNLTTNVYGDVARITHIGTGVSYSIGVRSFVGINYMLFSSVSIGGELGWGIGYTHGGTTTLKQESIGSAGGNQVVEYQTIKSGGGSQFWVDTDGNNPLWTVGGNLFLKFTF